MRKVYVPFSTASRCALTDWYHVPSFHACAFAPPFDDHSRIEPVSRDDIDRWKGLLRGMLARIVAGLMRRVTGWLAPASRTAGFVG